MSDNTNERDSIREKKQDAIGKGGVAITSHDHVEETEQEQNSASASIFRVDELLTVKNDHPIIRKLNRLKQVGLTDEMILDTYNELSGNVVTENAAMEVLKIVFDRYVEYFSELPNGIVLDPISGRIDFEASYEQRLELGILTDPFQGLDLSKKISIDDILNIDRNKLEKGFKDFCDQMQFLDSIFIPDLNVNIEEEIELFDDFLTTDIDKLNFSNKIKKQIVDDRKLLLESKYDNEEGLFEITRLEIELEDAKGTPAYSEILKRRTEFYEKHPEYIGKVPILDKDGNIVMSERSENEAYVKTFVVEKTLETIHRYQNISRNAFESLPENEQRKIVNRLLSGLACGNNQTEAYEEIYTWSKELLQRINPTLNLEKDNEKTPNENLTKFLIEKGIIKDTTELLDFSSAIRLGRRTIRNEVYKQIEKDNVSYKKLLEGKVQESLDVDMRETEMYKSYMQNYFVGSALNFSEDNVERANAFYKGATVTSWLQSKDETLELRYKGLILMKKRYDNLPESDYKTRKLLDIEQEIASFEDSFGTLGIDADYIYEKNDASYEFYKDNMGDASLVKFYAQDMLKMQKGKTYNDMSPKDKRAYIRNTLVGLNYMEKFEDKDFFLYKMVLRRLELMNTEDKQYVVFDDNGDYVINKDLILQEYSEHSDYEWKNFDELMESSLLRKEEYVLKKLGDYSRLNESEFVKLQDEDDWDLSIKQIEDARYEANKKELSIIQNRSLLSASVMSENVIAHIKEDLKFLADSRYNMDHKLYEIATYEIIRDRKFLKDDVERANAKIDAFYEKNPEYKGNVFSLDESGHIVENERKDFEKFKRIQSTQYTIAKLNKCNDMTRDDFQQLPKEEQKEIMMAMLSGLACRKINERAYSEIGHLCESFIKKIEPNLNLEKFYVSNEKTKFADFAREYLGYDENTNEISLTALMKESKIQIQEQIFNTFLKAKTEYVPMEHILQDNTLPIADNEARNVIEDMQEEMNTTGIDELSHKVATTKQERMEENAQNSQSEVKEDKKTQVSDEVVINEAEPEPEPEAVVEVEDEVDSSTGDGNMEAVSIDDSAVTNALVPIEEINKRKTLGERLTDIINSIKNLLVSKKKEESEHDEVSTKQKNATNLSNDSKGNDFKNQGPILTYEQQRENAMKMQGTQTTQAPQTNQVKNIDTQSDYEDRQSI